jgi:excisionase family DNA binding protein
MSPHVRRVRENRSTIGALTIAEVSDELRISESSVLRLVRSRRLRAISVGERKLIILREDLLKFLQESGATA